MLAGERRVEAVGDRVAGSTGTGRPASSASAQRGRALGLDADDADAERRDGGRDPRDEPAAADRDDDRVDVGGVLEDLEPDGALPRDHERIVERVDERRARLRDELVRAARTPPPGRRPRGRSCAP